MHFYLDCKRTLDWPVCLGICRMSQSTLKCSIESFDIFILFFGCWKNYEVLILKIINRMKFISKYKKTNLISKLHQIQTLFSIKFLKSFSLRLNFANLNFNVTNKFPIRTFNTHPSHHFWFDKLNYLTTLQTSLLNDTLSKLWMKKKKEWAAIFSPHQKNFFLEKCEIFKSLERENMNSYVCTSNMVFPLAHFAANGETRWGTEKKWKPLFGWKRSKESEKPNVMG